MLPPRPPAATVELSGADDNPWATPTSGGGPPVEAPPVEARAPERYVRGPELARGGLGRILEAYDRLLGRTVALKELLVESPVNRARFQREIRFTARLQHPAIVPIHDTGRLPDGRDFYTMKLVNGRTLDACISAAGTLEARLALLPHLLAVADAVAYAHTQRIVHRDIKPQNILVGPFGETVLIDWGIAKDLDSAEAAEGGDLDESTSSLTMVGSVVGTPAYMSPEQARGEPIDARADVYALGATLFQLLTGRLPYPGGTRTTIEALRAGASPPAVEALEPGIPADLVSIVRTAMAPSPADRYRDGAQLSEDLRRFSTGQLVGARQYTRGELVYRWARRNARILAVVAGALLVLGVSGAASVRRIVTERNLAREARAEAETRSNALTLAQARRAVLTDPNEAAAWLAAYPAEGVDWETAFDLALAVEARGTARLVSTAEQDCNSLEYSPDGRYLVPSGNNSSPIDTRTGAHLWDGSDTRPDLRAVLDNASLLSLELATGTLWRRGLPGGELEPLGTLGERPAALALGATHAVASTEQGGIYRIDPRTGAIVPLARAAAKVSLLDVRGDTWLAGADDGTVWGGSIASATAAVRARGAPVTALASGADGAVYIGDTTGKVRRVEVDGAERTLLSLPAPVSGLAVSADGAMVAAMDGVVTLDVLDQRTGTRYSPEWTALRPLGIAFSPNEPLLAVTVGDGSVRFWRPLTGTTESRYGEQRVFAPPRFAPDGRTVATCSMTGAVRTWDVPTPAGRTFRGHTGPAYHVVALPDGRIASDSEDRSVRLWDADGRSTPLLAHTDRVYGLAATRDGGRLLSMGTDGIAVVWDTLTARAATILRGHVGKVRAGFWLPGDTALVTGGFDGTLREWGEDGVERARVQAFDGAVFWAALAADGKSVLATGNDRTLRRWNLADHSLETLLEGLGVPENLAFRPFVAGAHVVVCDGKHELVVLGPDGATRRVPSEQRLNCAVMVASPDGASLAFATEDDEVHLLDPATLAVRPVGRHTEEVYGLAFSPDGRLLASSSIDGSVRLWRLADGAGYLLHQTDTARLGVTFTPDGRRVATADASGAVWVGDVDEARFLPRDPTALHARLVALAGVGMRVDASGR